MGGRRDVRIIGEHGNLWNNDLVVYNGVSNAVHLENFPHMSIMVNIYSDESNTTPINGTINFEASADGEHWTFCSQISTNLPQGGTSEAHIFETVGAKYIRLVRDDADNEPDVYITASLQAKP